MIHYLTNPDGTLALDSQRRPIEAPITAAPAEANVQPEAPAAFPELDLPMTEALAEDSANEHAE